MNRPYRLTVLRIAITLTAACVLAACTDKVASPPEAKKAAPPTPVLVGQAIEKPMPLRLHAVGNVETVASVAVKSRVDGQIVGVNVRDGQDVARGELLFRLDPRPFQSRLAQAEANLARGRAQLDYLRGQEQRYQELLRQNFVSQEGYAQVAANFRAAEASVNADAAAVEQARLDLDYTAIRSPIAGRAGKVMLSEGNLVKANDAAAMVVINQIAPIYVAVAVPERYLGEIRSRHRQSPLRVEAQLDKGRTVTGRLAFVDNSVDPATGTIRLRGVFDNRDGQLWPGQFVDVRVTLQEGDRVLVVPTQALQTGPKGQYVYVVGADAAAELRPVEVERTEGSESVIMAGLKAGETVVVDGASRLLPGARVSIAADGKGS